MDNRQNSTNINWYPGHMAKTKREIKEKITFIDIIYELVDSRTPYSSKLKDIREYTKNRPCLLIMTKKDLCDIKVTQKWVKYYENQGYKVILADLNKKEDIKEIVKTTKSMVQDLNLKRQEKGLKNKDIKVLVIGIPNVGKSTLINALVGKKVAESANKPGVTKNINWFKTNVGLSLLDTPGILWPKLDNDHEALALASTLAIKTDVLNILDIGNYLITFLIKYYPTVLKENYKIDREENSFEIMELLGQKMGFIKNGEVDYEKVALRIYNDLAKEKIKGVTFDQWQ